MRVAKQIGLLFCLYLTAISCGVSRNATLPQISDNTIHRTHPRLSSRQVDSLMAIYSQNKILIDEFLEPTLIALSYYPELRDAPIEFKYSKEATTMAARPKPLSMLLSRRYVVVINNDERFEGIHLDEIPFNAQIGIIGHELAHIADYERHNLSGVVGILLRYSSKSRKALFEREIDRATIERGLGWQLFDWAQFALDEQNGTSVEYREFKRTHYLTPKEIKRHILFFQRFSGESTP